MTPRPWTSLALALLPALAAAADAIPPERMHAIQAGTVMVVVSADQPICSGSGFMFGAVKDGLIATNAHVVDGVASEHRTVAVVIDSGLASEETLPATVLADDPADDVALLHVDAGVRFRPLELAHVESPPELSIIHVVGFPFGDALTIAAKHANVSVTSGAISSLHRDEAGVLRWIQIDADCNHGNSGGPVVDGSGAVLGLASAGVEGTSVNLAIPTWVIDEVVAGRACKPSMETIGGGTSWRISAAIVDPFQRIAGVTMVITPVSQLASAAASGEAAGVRRAPASVAGIDLVIHDGVASATVPGAALAADGAVAAQFCYHAASGDRWSRPIVLTPPAGSVFPKATTTATTAATSGAPAKGGWLGKHADGTPVLIPASAAATAPDLPADRPANAAAMLPDGPLGVISAGTTSVAGTPVAMGALSAVPLMSQLNCAACTMFSPDGTTLLVLDERGLLQRLDCTSWKPTLACRTYAARSVIQTSVGLVVPGPDVLVIDPVTLATKLQFKTKKPETYLTGSPHSKLIVCSDELSLSLYDAETGHHLRTIAKEKDEPNPAHRPVPVRPAPPTLPGVVEGEARVQSDSGELGYSRPLMSADGRWLYTVGPFDTVHRFAVRGTTIHWVESSALYGTVDLVGSGDGLYLAIVGQGSAGRSPMLRIFRASCIAWPIMTAPDALGHAATCAFDPAHKRVIWCEAGTTIHQLLADGSPGPDIPITVPHPLRVVRLVASPSGGGILIVSTEGLWWLAGA